MCLVAILVGAALGLLGVRLPTLLSASQAPLGQFGGHLAYVDSDDNLLVLDVAQGTRRQLVAGMNQRIRDPRWAPSGGELAYVAAPRIPGEENFIPNRSFDIYVISADGGSPRKITDQATNITQLAWFPDGGGLIYQTGFNGNFRIHTVSPDGRSQFLFPMQAEGLYSFQSNPRIAPTGQRVAFLHHIAGERTTRSTIVTSDMSGGTPSTVVAFGDDVFPSHFDWAPDGSAIAFGQGSTLREARLTSSAQPNLIADVGSAVLGPVQYSPDGATIAVGVSSNGSTIFSDAIVIVRRDGLRVGVLNDADVTSLGGRVQWLPDNNSILYARPRNQRSALYVGSSSGDVGEVIVGLGGSFDWRP
jgi:Tol biopolymer transport system component